MSVLFENRDWSGSSVINLKIAELPESSQCYRLTLFITDSVGGGSIVLNGEQPLLLLSDLQKFIGSLGTGSTVRSEKISALSVGSHSIASTNWPLHLPSEETEWRISDGNRVSREIKVSTEVRFDSVPKNQIRWKSYIPVWILRKRRYDDYE